MGSKYVNRKIHSEVEVAVISDLIKSLSCVESPSAAEVYMLVLTEMNSHEPSKTGHDEP